MSDSAPRPGAVYAAHFGLSAQPFGLTPDPTFLYLGPAHREALAAIEYALADRRGFVTLLGEVGTGKTTLLYSLLGRLQPEFQVAYVNYTHQGVRRLLASVLKDLGVAAPGTSKAALILALNRYLRRRGEEGGTTAIVIDEAQNLSDEAFEELRLLSNFETYTEKLLQIVLVGQPELQDRLRRPQLRQLQERVSVRSVVNPLPRDEMRRYIHHRLQRVGGSTHQLFTEAALHLIIRRAAGIPRRANILCHNALLFAYGRNLSRVTAQVAREAIAEMDGRRPGIIPRPALRRWMSAETARWVIASCVVAVVVVAALLLIRSSPPTSAPAVVGSLERSDIAPPSDSPSPNAGIPSSDAMRQDPIESMGGPVSEEAPQADQPAQPERPATDVGEVALPPSVTVPRGGTLYGLVNSIYGPRLREAEARELIAQVRRLNPRIKDPNVILAGDSLLLPPSPAASPGPDAASVP